MVLNSHSTMEDSRVDSENTTSAAGPLYVPPRKE